MDDINGGEVFPFCLFYGIFLLCGGELSVGEEKRREFRQIFLCPLCPPSWLFIGFVERVFCRKN